MPRNKRPPTAAKSGDTLDNLPTFNLARDLYEGERKEIYTGILARLSDLKSQRKKVADTLGITTDEETQITRVIKLYEGDDGILALFQNAEEEAEHTEQEMKKGGKDRRQRELPIDEVPSESTADTKASTEPVGVDSIDLLVTAVKPLSPSDMDWDGFRRNVVELSGDDRLAVREYAERWHQYQNAAPQTDLAQPQIPSFLHALFVDLSPAYAKALGGREDVLYKTDMERAMAKGKRRRTRRPTSLEEAQAEAAQAPDPLTQVEQNADAWGGEPLRDPAGAPVSSLAAAAEQESK